MTNTDDEYQEIYNLGYNMRNDGYSRDDNPYAYTDNVEACHSWIEGYDDADKEYCAATHNRILTSG